MGVDPALTICSLYIVETAVCGRLIIAVLFCFAVWPVQAQQPGISDLNATRPNIVFFLVDDLGWADLGCYGSTFHETPNIDALAASGMRFTNAYAASPVCSPTRASILTGRHPVRLDITDWIPGSKATAKENAHFRHVDDRDELPLEEVTIAEQLREHADYQTFFLGKWHLGDEGNWPTDQGFDVNIGGCHVGSPPGGYYAPWTNPNLQANEDGEYLTQRLTDEATALIHGVDRDRPFLMYFSYYNVHTPIEPDKRTIEHFKEIAADRFAGDTPIIDEHGNASRGRQDNSAYASMVRAVDLSVGQTIQAIEDAGIADNTIICFFSDNGGLCTLKPGRKKVGGSTSNLPLRSGKGWLYEGGIREPLIVRVPGVTEPGTVCDSPVISTDFFPTLLEWAGLPLDPKLHVDGLSFNAALAGQSFATRPLFFHYPHYHGSGWKPGAAIRDGNWKLIEFYETDETELYDLSTDQGETNDLAAREPAVRDRLKTKLQDWQREMGARMPQPR